MYEAAWQRVPGPALTALIEAIDCDLKLTDAEVPHAVRRRVQHALTTPEFFVDCAHRLLSQLAFEPATRYLYRDPQQRYNVQLFSWPAGFGNEPHLHTNWNVSAVFVGSLEIFRSARSPADCAESVPLVAAAGEAGVLIPPQFHFLRNPTETTALTFHVFSSGSTPEQRPHREGPAQADECRLDDDGILALAKAVAGVDDPRVTDIIRTAFAAAGNLTRLDLVKLMAAVDPAGGIEMGKRLAHLVGGSDGSRLLAVLEQIELAAP
jgi:hypothetical protein